MSQPFHSLIDSGTKLWLDSIDPELVQANRALGATGATSNPIIIADLIKTGRYDQSLKRLMNTGLEDAQVAWQMTDEMVQAAEEVFLPVWEATSGNDGYVSFEVDPLLEDSELGPPHEQRVASYVELGNKWSAGHKNRMIKVPATPAGIDALEELTASGVTLNITLLFTPRQTRAAREAVWRGAQRRGDLKRFKSVYSVFISRIDVYTAKHVTGLSSSAQGMLGIVNAKRIWADNQQFWSDKPVELQQEIIFASTGVKMPNDPPLKYVEALAGGDIQTNPPTTNDALEKSGLSFVRKVDQLPSEEVLAELDRQVQMQRLEETLIDEGIQKFSEPQKALLELIAEKRKWLAADLLTS